MAIAWLVALSGCGGDTDAQIIHGHVTVGDVMADSGEIRFVPIGDTPGSVAASAIVAGQYRIEGRGGLPAGTYRVEIVAKQKTGRQTDHDNGFEVAMVDEQIQISPPHYAGAESPLTCSVTDETSGTMDFNIAAAAGEPARADE
ncbi:MAG: hypothetical protein R3C10_21290 [Pirellulales bacterium]